MGTRNNQQSNRRKQIQRRRRAAVALLVVVGLFAIVAAQGVGLREPAPNNNSVAVVLEKKVLAKVRLAPYMTDELLDTNGLQLAIARQLPRREVLRSQRSRVEYAIDRVASSRRAATLGAVGGTVEAVAEPLSSRIDAPVIRQRYRNNCETAALASMLSALGRDVTQTQLQREIKRSAPLDPVTDSTGMVWGDPDEGFVGRHDGGGVAGGFGVYPKPIAELANRYGVRLENLTKQPVQEIFSRVRRGLPVFVWIGLSDGPYGAWKSAGGRRIRVNWGEHTVLLTGVTENDQLRVMNPLEGTVEEWDRPTFEAKWSLLDRRALGARQD